MSKLFAWGEHSCVTMRMDSITDAILSAWYSLASWSAVVAPLINYGIGQINAVLAPWRWMYIVAGSQSPLQIFDDTAC